MRADASARGGFAFGSSRERGHAELLHWVSRRRFSVILPLFSPETPKEFWPAGAREVVSASAVSLRFLSYTWAEAENLSLRFLTLGVLNARPEL